MKTAEEWYINDWYEKIHSEQAAIELVKRIQADALRYASDIAGKYRDRDDDIPDGVFIAKEILGAIPPVSL